MQSHRMFLIVTAFLSGMLLVADASAQFGGIGGGVFGSRGARGGARGDIPPGGGQTSRNERTIAGPDANSYEQIEYRLSLLQDDLRLSAEQNPAWQAFATKVRAYAGDVARERARGMRPNPASAAQNDGLQHVEQAVDAARNRLTALEDVELSAKALYQTLTPEQKGLLDTRIATIVAPRPTGLAGGATDSNLPDLGSGSRRSR